MHSCACHAAWTKHTTLLRQRGTIFATPFQGGQKKTPRSLVQNFGLHLEEFHDKRSVGGLTQRFPQIPYGH